MIAHPHRVVKRVELDNACEKGLAQIITQPKSANKEYIPHDWFYFFASSDFIAFNIKFVLKKLKLIASLVLVEQ